MGGVQPCPRARPGGRNPFRGGGFTNLSRDHLDFHATMEAYFDAKARLVRPCIAAARPYLGGVRRRRRRPRHGDASGRRDHRQRRGHPADWTVEDAVSLDSGLQGVHRRRPGRRAPSAADRPRRAASNVAQRAAGAGHAGRHRRLARAGLLGLRAAAVPGRFQNFSRPRPGLSAVVDYAHKPGALRAVLKPLRRPGAGGDGRCRSNSDPANGESMGRSQPNSPTWWWSPTTIPRRGSRDHPAAVLAGGPAPGRRRGARSPTAGRLSRPPSAGPPR